jgi:plasmid stabilization system protein ParE
MKLEFLPAAAEDLIDAAAYYESDLRGLGYEFMLEVQRITRVLVEQASLGKKIDQFHRRVALRRFPYALIFRHDGDIIRIVAVAHHRRRPRYWAGRVHDRGVASETASW